MILGVTIVAPEAAAPSDPARDHAAPRKLTLVMARGVCVS